MSSPNILISPVIIKFYLYRHNYTDRKLISELKKHFFYDEEGSSYVRAHDLAQVVRVAFAESLRHIRKQPKERLAAKATSLFFLDEILRQYAKLKYLEVSVLHDEVYTRRSSDDGDVSFDYRIVYSKIDLSAVVDPGFLNEIKEVFRQINVYDHTVPSYDRQPYFQIFTSELVRKLGERRSMHAEGSEQWAIVDSIIPFFNNKLHEDDSQLLIVMEN